MSPVDSSEVLHDAMIDGAETADEPEAGLGEGGVDPPGSPPSSGNRRWRVPVAAAVVAAVGALIAWAVWPSSTPATSIHIPAIAPNAVTTAGGQQLISLLRSGQSATYHAAYEVTGAATQSENLSLQVWQSPPNLREDSVITHGAQVAKSESFLTTSGGRLCTQLGSAPWTCHPVPKAQSAENGVAGVLSYVADSVSGHGVAVSKKTIDGMSATCFTVQTADQPRLCANADGVPLLVTDHNVTYKLQSYAGSVPQSVFSPPA